ncbi:MAG: permease [Planctomycetes bacterium]|nr:permease [Planctomycetota bacterium]MBI3834284.1 permease [Planctomycetota bacterium]
MNAISVPFLPRPVQCYYRPTILVAATITLLCTFWFASRYPQLLNKARHVGQHVPSMTYSHELLAVSADAPAWKRIIFGAVNWLDGMKIGMTFGVLFGALLHTALRYYPLKIGKNLYLNSLKGALVGVPAGVCANCSVPAACGVTRGHGRVEVALGFLFSSPNFNPVVMAMTFAALPLAMSVTKYAVLLAVIIFVVPALIGWLERDRPMNVFTVGDEGHACSLPPPAPDCSESFATALKGLAGDFAGHVWMLVKPTITLMLLASLASSVLLTLVPWTWLLAEVTPARVALVSLISVFMPVPIALDVMFAAQLQSQGVAPGYVMLFALTLGTYSIIPSIYLWREVSRPLAVILFAFFLLVGCISALLF